ncbi:MAG TPA: glycosyltransferase [Candidatus Saccharimonadales bacterium]
MNKHLVIDCQLLQTSDRNRGMGLYLFNLLNAFRSSKVSSLNLKFIVNSTLPDLSEEDQELLNSLGEITRLKLLSKKDSKNFEDASKYNRDILMSLSDFKQQEHQTIFYIPALFSSEIYPVFPANGSLNLMFFHDIIPFLYSDQYFSDPESEASKDYAQRWREAYRTDLFVANSQTTADDLIVYFGIDPSRIVTIYGAAAHNDSVEIARPNLVGLSKDYVLMPSGDDYRKNNQLAVQAFSGLGTNEQLVITSNFGEATKQKLLGIYKNIVFSGSVSSPEYLWLVDNAKCVFFPSRYEGLGMPILEAVNRGAIIACSDIPVFKEISDSAFNFFNPKSQTDIKRALNKSIATSKNKQPTKQYEPIRQFFTWQKTADRFLDALKEIKPAPKKLKLAIFAPSMSSYSAIGKYAFTVHGELSRYFDIDYYCENGLTVLKSTRPNILKYAAGYYQAADFDIHKNSYDRVLYNIGNSEFHVQTIINSLRYPANAIFHDTWLNGVFDYMETYGYLTGDRRKLESLLDNKLSLKRSSCIASVATNQKQLFSHSNYAKESIREIKASLPITTVSLPVGVPKVFTDHETVIISFAGIISEDKGISLVSEVAALDKVSIKIFGYSVLGDSPLLSNLAANVELMYDLTDKEFQDNLRDSDILINFRVNYHGETSLSTLEAMRYGAVVIVNDVGWFSELPDDSVVKVASEHEAIEAIKELVKNKQKRRSTGLAARKFLSDQYSFGEYASLLNKALKG